MAMLVKGFAAVRKDQLRMLSLAKTTLTKELTKAERKEASKSLNAIKDSADLTISNTMTLPHNSSCPERVRAIW